MALRCPPAARFVRTALALDFSQRWLKEQRGQRVRLCAHALHLLSQVAVLHGQCVEHADAATGDFTQWRLVRDHDLLELHYAGHDSLGPWRIAFADFQLSPGSEAVFLPLTRIPPMPALQP